MRKSEISLENVKEHATLPAGTCVDHGVEDDFFGLVSFLSVHFCRIWFYQILSLNMDHFF